jgi:glutathione S-transferase
VSEQHRKKRETSVPTTQPITLFHSPQTRSTGALSLLEELHAPYSLHVLDMKAGKNREAAYLAVNPMGKVPAILHGDVLVTEQVAIGIYLADLFPEAGITPAIGDALRGPYLRWYAFYGSSFEPALIDKALKREAPPVAMSPYGTVESTVQAVVQQLSRGPWMLGEKFTAVDVLWGTALTWMTGFGLVESVGPVKAYVERWNARPVVKTVAAIDAKLIAARDGVR